MNIATLKSGAAAPFAHLFGRAPKVDAKAEEPKDDKDKKDAKAEEPCDDKDKKAESGDDKDKDGDKDKKDAKKSKAESDDEDDKEEMKAQAHASGNALGIQAERARWVSTLSNPAAAGRGEAALTLLSTTDLASEQIVATLKSLPAATAKSGGLSERMNAAQIPNPGNGGNEAPADGPQAAAAAMMAVYDRLTDTAKK